MDGNEYLDYNAGIGPISLGYSYDVVDNAIKRQLDDGITFSLVHPLEVELAELIRAVVPNAESVRYGKTGAEVTLKIRGLYFPSIQNHHGAQRGKRQMARKEKTAIKHVGCGGVVLEYCSWGWPMYQCSKCYQKSREIDFFMIHLLLAQLGGQKQNDDTSS